MADIVERLRGLADLFEAGDAPRHLVLHMRAGADAIERKKAEIASLLNTLADTRTENMRLRAALELYRDAVRIDATMEGPKFMGANSSALKRAWDADLAALEGK